MAGDKKTQKRPSSQQHGRVSEATEVASGIQTPSSSEDDLIKPARRERTLEETKKRSVALSHGLSPDMRFHDFGPKSHSPRFPWTWIAALLALVLAALIAQSFLTRQLDVKGCAMSYMRPNYARFDDFDTEHTRLASKYSLYLYREGVLDDDTRLKGVPVLFIPGNAGSYRQVRSMAAESAVYYHEMLAHDLGAAAAETRRPLDFFAVDFNEDITAFHGQTLLDQAEYLNEAIVFILEQYRNPNRSLRDAHLPLPTSVILIGHSMGGVVARTMLTLPKYQAASVNTIITLAAPHARAPVSFDADVVHIYSRVNTYWHDAFARPTSTNPLSNVTLISIAGGSLDTIVPSDYSTVASLVPSTHGFTVFTSTIPTVWTSMDHLAITWCDQLRKRVIKSLYRIIDPSLAHQTRSVSQRMQVFRQLMLTGMEDVAERRLAQTEPTILLTLPDAPQATVPKGQRLEMRSLGSSDRMEARLLAIPPRNDKDASRLSIMTDQALTENINEGFVKIMLCGVITAESPHRHLVEHWDLSEGRTDASRLACKHVAQDTILLPASRQESRNAFEPTHPFSYLQYDLTELAEHQFVTVIDRLSQPSPGWVLAEFASENKSRILSDASPGSLLLSGLQVTLEPGVSLMNEVKLSALQSSLLAFRLSIDRGACNAQNDMFAPILRQSIDEPHESKFYVNARDVEISLHGVAPYLPRALAGNAVNRGLSLHLWADPSCKSATTISLHVDIVGSLGKLWMRYRTVFASFPLIIVAMVLDGQFRRYDKSGTFISFTESMDQCLHRSIPLLLTGLSIFAMSMNKIGQAIEAGLLSKLALPVSVTEAAVYAADMANNDLLLGYQNSFFWFLVPMFGLLSVGVCILLNHLVLAITYVGALACSSSRAFPATELSTTASLGRRVATTAILLLLVSTVIPYQFLYIIICIVQLVTSARASGLAKAMKLEHNINVSNYSHSILILLLWVLPVNLPVLVVWIHNLGVEWLAPFPSHHNVLAILPFVLLVETSSTGSMVPRLPTPLRQLTTSFLVAMAACAALYGVAYAYRMHWMANLLCVWLIGAHLWGHYWSIRSFTRAESPSSKPSSAGTNLRQKQTANQ